MIDFLQEFVGLATGDVLPRYHTENEEAKVFCKFVNPYIQYIDGEGWSIKNDEDRWVLSTVAPMSVLAAFIDAQYEVASDMCLWGTADMLRRWQSRYHIKSILELSKSYLYVPPRNAPKRDFIQEWIEECCVENIHKTTQIKRLYESFAEYCDAQLDGHLTMPGFVKALSAKGFRKTSMGGHVAGFRGLVIKEAKKND